MVKTLLILSLLCLSTLTYAQSKESYDPLRRNLIFVEGDASATVPVSGFSIEIDFDESRKTFSLASETSYARISNIEASLKAAGIESISILKGWDLIKQNTLSLESKAKIISNKTVISIGSYPKDKLHNTLARAIDIILKESKKITIKNVSVYLSPKEEKAVKQKLTLEAIANMKTNASAIAKSLGKKNVLPKRVYYHTRFGIPDRSFEAQPYMQLSSAKVSYNKRFRFKSEIVDQIKLSTSVSGVFQIY